MPWQQERQAANVRGSGGQKKAPKWVGNVPKMSPKWLQNDPQTAPKWLPGGLLAACGVPGGPWGAQVRFLSDFGAHLGSHLGLQRRPQIGRNRSQNRASLFIIIFGPLEGSGATFWGPFWGDLGVLFGCPGGKHKYMKIVLAPTWEHDF